MTFKEIYEKLEREIPEAAVNGRIRLDKYIPRRYAVGDHEAVKKACAFLEELVDEYTETIFDDIICKLYENENAEEIYKQLGSRSRKVWNEYAEYPVITGKLFEYLRSELPALDIEGEEDFPHYVAGRYADHVVGCFKSGDHEEVRRRLKLSEWLVNCDNRFIVNLGVTGYLEDMLDEVTIESKEFYSLLGESSKMYWRALIKDWYGIDVLLPK